MQARLPLIAAFVAATFLPGKAFAQAWVSSPDLSEGVGIRAGNLEIHPSVGAEFGYDSNVYRSSENEGVIDALKLRVTPSVSLTTLGRERLNTVTPPSVAFAGDAYVSYFELFPLDSSADDARRRDLAAGVSMKADIFPRRKFGADLHGAFSRIVQTDGDIQDIAGAGFNRDVLQGGAGVTWRPGGGLFEWRGGYMATYHFFESDSFKSLNNIHHEIGTRGRWRFLPRSALLFDSTYTLVRYANSTVQTDGDMVRARVGFHGLVTYHLALLGMIGWGASFYEGHPGSTPPRQYDAPLANAEIRWFMQPRVDLEQGSAVTGLSSVALGYTRSFSNSYLGSFYQSDRGYLQFSALLANAFVSGVEFGVARVAFPESSTAGAFEQLRLGGRAFGEYRFTETLGVNATVQYDQVNSPVVAGEDLDYRRWQAYVGIRWFM